MLLSRKPSNGSAKFLPSPASLKRNSKLQAVAPRRNIVNWITKLTIGLKSLFQKQRVERELDEELEGYLEASAAHKRRTGMTAEAAHRAAMVEMGSRNAVKHQVWSARWESTLEGLLQDTRLS